MSALRRMSTPHLLALCAAVAATAAGGTAIASALAGHGTPPPFQRLGPAVHQALSAPPLVGISAHIKLTNQIVDSASFNGSDPVLTGGEGRLWFAPGQHKLRLSLNAGRSGADSQLVIDNGRFWAYDDRSRTVYRGSLPQHASPTPERAAAPGAGGANHVPPLADIERAVSRLRQHLTVSEPRSGVVARQGTYTVRVSPPQGRGGLLGGVEVAWDAARGVPLRFAVYAQDRQKPVLELVATDIKYGTLPADSFNAAPPPGSKTVDVSTGSRAPDRQHPQGHADAAVTGLSAVQAAVPFQIDAPPTLHGLPRHEVRLLGLGRSPAALVTYGDGLGGIAVIERAHTAEAPAPKGSSEQGRGHDQGALPSIQIKEATGHELPTALGTVITFGRAGVDYTVAGSVAANVAEAAARAL